MRKRIPRRLKKKAKQRGEWPPSIWIGGDGINRVRWLQQIVDLASGDLRPEQVDMISKPRQRRPDETLQAYIKEMNDLKPPVLSERGAEQLAEYVEIVTGQAATRSTYVIPPSRDYISEEYREEYQRLGQRIHDAYQELFDGYVVTGKPVLSKRAKDEIEFRKLAHEASQQMIDPKKGGNA